MADNGTTGDIVVPNGRSDHADTETGQESKYQNDQPYTGGEEESMDGYPNSVHGGAGQRKAKGLKNEERKIFVGGIPWDTTDDDLKSYFGQFGEVAHAQVKYDHFTGRSRGFAFVEFANADACREALKQKDRDIKGKRCEVKPAKSRENKKIFIGGLPSDYSEHELKTHFEQYGKVDEIEWPYDKVQGKKKNFAFVVFDDEDAAAQAASTTKQRFGERLCDVKIAVPQYMRPQKQAAAGGWGNYQSVVTGGWGGDYNYNSYGYGGYGGGYNYYDDRYTYDYGGYPVPGTGAGDYASWQGYDSWGGYSGAGTPAIQTASGGGGGGGGGYRSGNRSGGGGGGYSNYY